MRAPRGKAALCISMLGAIAAGCGIGTIDGELALDQLEEQPFQLLDDVHPGETYADGTAAVVVPDTGLGVVASVLHDDGSAEILRLETLPDGRVVRYFDSDEFHEVTADKSELAEMGSKASHPECSQGAYSLLGFKWTRKMQWRANLATRPGYLLAGDVRTALNRSATVITQSLNPCGLADQVSASHEYLGTTSRQAGVSSAGACLASDGVNVMSFGALPSGVLAITCTYFDSARRAVTSDIKFNRAVSWYPAARPTGCTNRFSLRAVAVHEIGHLFGLGHVSESSYPLMTMSTNIGPCDNSHANLGLGDVRGLRQIY